ncbi:hypothetical protein PQX77_006956 [Marasmius sp. AFHP31]|nr:hypothetical protein PQX77_006956 [Marasmius sp. AFHP31]
MNRGYGRAFDDTYNSGIDTTGAYLNPTLGYNYGGSDYSTLPVASPTCGAMGSSLPQASPVKRKAKAPKEKRQARYRGFCPNAVSDRLERAMQQRLYLFDRKREMGALREVFTVSGSTGNVYTVTIDHTPRCNCPDNLKGNHCKHVLFVFMRILQVDRSSGHWYQKALLTSELEEVFDNAPPSPQAALANQKAVEAWKEATGQPKQRVPAPEDNCPICHETMHDPSKPTVQALADCLEWCKQCGSAVHIECWDGYTLYLGEQPDSQLICAWCRASWDAAPERSARPTPSQTQEGYVNLAGAAGLEGVSPVRDTSSYYDGPTRRTGYGYGYGHRRYY